MTEINEKVPNNAGQEKPSKKKGCGCFSVLLILIIAGLFAMSGGDGDTESGKDGEAAKPLSVTEEQQEAFLEFEKKIYETEKLGEYAQEKFLEVTQSPNQASVYSLYQAAKDNMEGSERVWQALHFLSVEVPKELPRSVRKKVKEAIEDFSTAYYCKKSGMKKCMEWLDSGSMEDQSKMEDEMKSFQVFILQGTTQMLSAKDMMQIELVPSE